MRDVSELRPDLLDGRLVAARDPEDASSGARIARVAQLADRGDHAAAAREAADLLEARIYDIRLIGFYLFGLFLERGIRYLPLLLGHVGRLVSDDLDALGPSRRKLQVVSSATAWLFENVSARLQYHTKQRDALWESWRAASDSALADAIAAGCTKVTLALEGVIDAPLAATPLARVRRWTHEDLRRAVARREAAAERPPAVAVVAAPPEPPIDEPANEPGDEPRAEPDDELRAESDDELAGELLAEPDDDERPDAWADERADDRGRYPAASGHATERRRGPASDPHRGAAPDPRGGQALDRRNGPATDRRNSSATERRSNPTIDRRSGHAVDPRGSEASDRRSGTVRDRRAGQRQDRRSRPPSDRREDPARDGSADEACGWDERPDDAAALESPALVALRAKLHGFQDLVARGELAKAAIVASDVRTLLASFDPVVFFPAMFAGYFRALHHVVDDLAPYFDSTDQPAWHALDSYYRADIRGFFDE